MNEAPADREAAVELLKTAALVDFEIVKRHAALSPAGDNIVITTVELQFGGEDEPGADVEWVAFGFIFAMTVLSFADARPRGVSDKDFVEDDQFTVADLFRCLRYERGQLQPFEERFERMVQFQARQEPKAPRAELERRTLAHMAEMPAWKDHPRVKAAKS